MNPELLSLRSWVLRDAGYTVEEQSNLNQALKVFLAGDFDLVVLCHSVPPKERQSLTAAIKAAKPTTPVLDVRADGEVTPLADASVHSLDGAEALLKCLGELMSRGPSLQITKAFQRPA